jgi:hypothetical protein
MNNEAFGDQRRETIRRIAETLGVAEDIFYDDCELQPPSFFRDASQVLELVKLFSSITNLDVRLSCLDHVRNCGNNGLGPTNALSDDGGQGN